MSQQLRQTLYNIKEHVILMLIDKPLLTATEVVNKLQFNQDARKIPQDIVITETVVTLALTELEAEEKIIANKDGRYIIIPQL